MSAVDAGIVFLPRFTTLVGHTDFTTAPLDVSRQGGAQFQIWRGPIRTASGPGEFNVVLEESLDAQSWALGPSTAQAFTIQENVTQFFSYSFRLRWFRLKFTLAGSSPMVTCWAEGLLRGGDGGLWGVPGPSIGAPAGAVGWDRGPGGDTGRSPADSDPWEGLRRMEGAFSPSWSFEDQVAFKQAYERERLRAEMVYRSTHGGAAPPGGSSFNPWGSTPGGTGTGWGPGANAAGAGAGALGVAIRQGGM